MRLSSSTHVETSPSTQNPVRIIPGFVGIVQAAKLLKQMDILLSLDGAVSVTDYVNANGGTVIGCLGDIKNFLNNGKLDQVVAIVKSCSSNMIDNLTMTMKDLSGTIPETIHHKVIGDGGYGNDITVGDALILANVSIFSPKPSMYYLNITMKNTVKVSVTDYVNTNGGTVIGCLGDIKNFLNNGKLDQVVAIVKSCSSNMIGNLTMTMKDLSGTIPETIHHKVIGDGGYGNDITVGDALILANISIFSPKPSMYYLNITMKNTVKVFFQIILTGIDNNIYSTVDAFSNACEMWKAIERSQQATTRNKGKAIVNSPQPIYDQEPSMVAEDDETSQDREIDKLMALTSLSFKKIYKPTNNNLRTSSNTSRANQDNSPRINRSAGYENQKIGNVAGARETVGSTMVQKSGIQCYNCKGFGHVARECQKPKRAKDAAYHREKMLLYQELEAHYMYMAQLQEVSLDAADFGPIFDDEPLQKVSNDDHYNVFAIESEHPEQSESIYDTYPIDEDAHNVIIDSLDMSYDREEIDQNDDDNDLANDRELLASLIKKLKCEIDESKNRNKFLETSNKVLIEKLKGEIEDFKTKNKSLESSNNRFKEANNKLSETNNLLYTDYKKSEAELARRYSMEYASQMEIECEKADRTMLSVAKVPLFFWAEAIATACFTQNRSLVIPRHEKTLYQIINDRKPSVKFFHIFGTVYYIVRDGENLDKMKEKGDECIFVGVVSKSSAVFAADAPYQRQHHTNPLNNHTTHAPTCQAPTLVPTVISSENINQAETYAENDQVADDKFINIFSTSVQDQRETSSRHEELHQFDRQDVWELVDIPLYSDVINLKWL
nr:hypothetical protein [Tanacetum cinerariifolium]